MSLHLVVGAAGLVGGHLMRVAADNCLEVAGVGRSLQNPDEQLDIRRSADVMKLVGRLNPAVIYLPAAITNVEYCELNPSETYATNVTGVCNVVQAANEIGAKLVYFSSDYIFDGENGPYREDDPANPINEYGRQKLIAEHFVALHARDYLIVRTTVVYGWESQGKNFIYRLLNILKKGHIIKVPIDQIGSPTYAPSLAQAVLSLALSDAKGIYNLVGTEQVNRYEFACEAARVFDADTRLVQPVMTSDLKQAARRPLNAGMYADKARPMLKTSLVGYHEGLRMMVGRKDSIG